MSVRYKHPRGTRAALNTLAAANGLIQYQVYLLTDEGHRPVVATSVSAFVDVALKSDLPHIGTTAPTDTSRVWIDTN